jgi:dTDP-4-amino-4,6-dideoxygalactose transaminase
LIPLISDVKAENMIPFNKPFLAGKEIEYITEALLSGQTAGDGDFTKNCQNWIEQHTGCPKALLTHSCTGALEMTAILADVQPGDEVIMPSYTFVSTANAFVLRGGVPVFVDIRPDTLNIDENLIEAAITPRTRAIVPVHYAGVACEMDTIMDIASRHNLLVIEDAAQGIMSTYKGKALGTIGNFGALSFHETKNITSGEGGAVIVNDPRYIERSEIVREKGTNRSQFFRGHVDKYTWMDIGSSFLPSEIIAACLYAQLEYAESITARRIDIWNEYHRSLAELEAKGFISRPVIPDGCRHNAHLYYILLESPEQRNRILAKCKEKGIGTVFHYIPLHNSPAGRKYGRVHGKMTYTENLSERLLRLPLWPKLTSDDQAEVLGMIFSSIRE